MVTYSLEAVSALLKPIPIIDGRPTFSTLWHLAQNIYDTLQTLDHIDHPDEGWSGYMMTREEFTLISKTHWVTPDDVGQYFEMPPTALTQLEQKAAESQWKYKKNIQDNYDVIKTALKKTFERVIPTAYQSSGNTGIMGRGFGNLEAFQILQRLRSIYGKATLPEIESNYLHLAKPMDRNLPIEVLINDIEDVQRFFLADPAENAQMSEVQLINHALIKLAKTGGIYTKAIERWNIKDLMVRQKWNEFKIHFVSEYKKILAAGGGTTTMAQEGYGSAYNAIEDDGSSLAESIVQYAERATAAESKVSDLESRLTALELGPQAAPQPPPPVQYHPHQAYNIQQTQGHPPPGTINIPQASQTFQNKRKTNNHTKYNCMNQNPRMQQQQGNQHTRYRGNKGRNRNPAFSNPHKTHLNLLYCYSCGYDVDHDGYTCPPHCQKPHHLPHITRDIAHTINNACMKAQHKTLLDGTGAGLGWILENNLGKARYVTDQREAWKKTNTQGPSWQQTRAHNAPSWTPNQRPPTYPMPPTPNPPQQNHPHPMPQAHNTWQMTPQGYPTPMPPQTYPMPPPWHPNTD